MCHEMLVSQTANSQQDDVSTALGGMELGAGGGGGCKLTYVS